VRERFKAMADSYRLTREVDPRLDLWMALSVALPLVAGIVLGLVIGGIVLWAITGLLLGLTFALFVFGRRLQTAQIAQIEGMPGAAAAILNQLRGQWFVTPAVGANKQQEMVHRVVGRPGIVLVTEGGTSQRVKGLLSRERKKLSRVAGDAPVHIVMVGDGEGDTVELGKLQSTMLKLPNDLKKTEVPKLARRLAPLDKGNIPMPKGYIPRGGRPR
jgi:hypothetical protein